MNPDITIITVAYNAAETIGATIKSVLNQTYINTEYIIVDGCSTDGTIDIVKSFADDRITFISEPDKGIYDAMNKGINLATGKIVGILNSDDFYADVDVIEKVVANFKQTNCEALYGDLLYVDGVDTSKIIRTWVAGKYKHSNFLQGWMPPHPTFFVLQNVYEKYGLFNLALKSAADYELLLRFLYKHKIRASYLPKTLVHMRTGGISNRNIGNRIKANLEDRKAWKMNNIKPRFYTLFLKPVRKISQFFIKD
ncbi:MAG: glycosyltransferase [Pedobacter sp.]|nr:glycosyltransferase [Chitinophagaceae bacterium]